jgi:hypothetical protein
MNDEILEEVRESSVEDCWEDVASLPLALAKSLSREEFESLYPKSNSPEDAEPKWKGGAL